jgi:outer membrane protein
MISSQMIVPIISGVFNSPVMRKNAALFDKAKSDFDNLRRAAAPATRQTFTGFF